MNGKVIAATVEKIAVRTGVPIGGFWLLIFCMQPIDKMMEFRFVTRDGSFIIKLSDGAIIVGIHASVCLLIRFVNRPLFWANPAWFGALRKAQREFDEA